MWVLLMSKHVSLRASWVKVKQVLKVEKNTVTVPLYFILAVIVVRRSNRFVVAVVRFEKVVLSYSLNSLFKYSSSSRDGACVLTS